MNEIQLADAHVQTWQAWCEACRRQSILAREADKNDPWIQGLMEESLNDIEGCD